jgi:hypothetical protein
MTREEIHKLPWKAQEYINKLERKLNLTHDVKSDSELLSCPNTSCPIIRYDNGESYCTKCHYTD